MVQRKGGARRKTRKVFRKKVREKGKISITKYLQEFKKGEKVVLKAEPAYQKGVYFRRFHGKSGLVKKKTGSCYEISIKDGNKEKTVIVHPVHLKRG